MADDELTLVLVLHENDRLAIRNAADAVSRPFRGADHLTREELRQLVRLPDSERRAVLDWLRENGMQHMEVRSVSGQTIFVRTGKEQLAKVFGPDSIRWIETDDSSVVPPAEWPIPRQLSSYVQSV